MAGPAEQSTAYHDVVALVPAAGRSARFGSGSKPFLQLGDRTLLRMTVVVVAGYACRVLVGVNADEMAKADEEVGDLAEIHPGGPLREDTIFGLFERTSEPIVLIHDPVHPFVRGALLERTINEARTTGAAMAVAPVQLPAVRVSNGILTGRLPRDQTYLPRSPQVYRREILTAAYSYATQHHIDDESPWELLLRMKTPVVAVPSEETNIKITTLFDWEMAKKLFAASSLASGGAHRQ